MIPHRRVALVDALPESPARTRAAENAFRRYLAIDREAAIEWAMKQPPGNTADRSFEQLSQKNSYAEPAASLEWAAPRKRIKRKGEDEDEICILSWIVLCYFTASMLGKVQAPSRISLRG